MLCKQLLDTEKRFGSIVWGIKTPTPVRFLFSSGTLSKSFNLASHIEICFFICRNREEGTFSLDQVGVGDGGVRREGCHWMELYFNIIGCLCFPMSFIWDI